MRRLAGRDPIARYIQLFLVTLIVFNILLFVFSTEKEFYSANSTAFDACEACEFVWILHACNSQLTLSCP